MHLALASVIQRFDMELYDPSYTLELKQTLTIKPNHFYIKASARPGKTYATGMGPAPAPPATKSTLERQAEAAGEVVRKRLYVAYGSNTGSCESFAQRIASVAQTRGIRSGYSII